MRPRAEPDEVRDRQQPLHEPEPAAEPRRELACELERIGDVLVSMAVLSVANQTTGTGGASGISGVGSRCGIRSSVSVHFGIHQFASPRSFIRAGTRRARMTVASKMIPAATPIASD